ncbi:MAG TPA: DUF2330 domain-containing protein [Polyangiaceae bacterium]|nr:DUF2330 domain-containing protein [Polyangiaceae bacterium]
MKRFRHHLRTLGLALAALTLEAQPKPAEACGGFFAGKLEERPSLSYEQTLIVYDDQKSLEHFVREVVFDKGNTAFGFVVPTPGRPEVFPVQKNPFKDLTERFPLFPPMRSGLMAAGGTGFSGKGGGADAVAVEVLETKRVGSFKTFVLAARDPGAFANWLKQQGFASTPEADRWLAHYVTLGFYFVALRYEPPGAVPKADAEAPPSAETIRISFPTPLPFYPYLEPDAAAGAKTPEQRGLEVWLVTRQRSLPIAARKRATGGVDWLRPLESGASYGGYKENLAGALGEMTSLLPDGSLFVQRFVDQKRSRAGFGDILFVPEAAGVLPPERREALRALLPLLDPELLPKGTP